MGKSTKTAIENKKNGAKSSGRDKRPRPRCFAIAQKGIQTGSDFARMMAALMSDLVDERISPRTANSVISAGDKLLRVAEMQLKYGRPFLNKKSELNLISGKIG